jgi:hypothetical protein
MVYWSNKMSQSYKPLWIPTDLKHRLKLLAIKSDMSMVSLIEYCIEKEEQNRKLLETF